jgi:hypothetical protein
MYPRIFYARWGYRHLGYKHYGFLLNREMILASIPSVQQWFFKDFLRVFDRQLSGYRGDQGKENLLRDLDKVPDAYRPDTVRGIGMLVGAEMCFDPLLRPDYPLDSRAGCIFEDALREAFYAGVEMGFAETASRFRRTLLVSGDDVSSRCSSLETGCVGLSEQLSNRTINTPDEYNCAAAVD